MALFGQVLRNGDNDYKSRNNVLISGSVKIIFLWFWKKGWKFYDNKIIVRFLHKKSSGRDLGTLFYKKYTNTLHNNDQRGKWTILVLFECILVFFAGDPGTKISLNLIGLLSYLASLILARLLDTFTYGPFSEKQVDRISDINTRQHR